MIFSCSSSELNWADASSLLELVKISHLVNEELIGIVWLVYNVNIGCRSNGKKKKEPWRLRGFEAFKHSLEYLSLLSVATEFLQQCWRILWISTMDDKKSVNIWKWNSFYRHIWLMLKRRYEMILTKSYNPLGQTIREVFIC